MVSTRGVRVKFCEGERVLCYEPDPTKAKVLYDSKVLQIVHDKESKGRKQVEYLIHFQGWNASWDRRVSEEYVLKDTEENRDLQGELAEKAHIKLSIKSNRVLVGPGSTSKERKRRRRLSETIRETIERERKNKSESDTSSQTGTSTEDDTASLSSDIGSITTTGAGETDLPLEEEVSDENSINRLYPVVIPDPLKAVLEKDFYLINEKNKLVHLPSPKSILSILEDYVKYFAIRYVARTREKRKTESKEKGKHYITLDLCKEIIDGIRVCFDFYLHTLLLYPRERLQAEKIRKAAPFKVEKIISISSDSASSRNHTKDADVNRDIKPLTGDKEKEEAAPRRILRSSRPLTEDYIPATEFKEINVPAPAVPCDSGRSTPSTLTSGASTHGTESCPLNDVDVASLPLHYRGISHQLKNWTLLPERYRNPPSPVLLYGPVHLLRLFVKMPEILYKMNLSNERKKVILLHLDLFLEYLNLHIHDFFTDANYVTYTEH